MVLDAYDDAGNMPTGVELFTFLAKILKTLHPLLPFTDNFLYEHPIHWRKPIFHLNNFIQKNQPF